MVTEFTANRFLQTARKAISFSADTQKIVVRGAGEMGGLTCEAEIDQGRKISC
jgi:hypothetical protein